MAHRCSALIVDDDADARRLLRMTLQLEASEIELLGEAASAQLALDAWRAHRPDVLVLDFKMPGRDGLEVAAEVLAEDPRQPVVLLSAHLEPDLIERATALGVRECVSKTRLSTLASVVRKHCPDPAA